MIPHAYGIARRARSKASCTGTDRSCRLVLPIASINAARNRSFVPVSGANAAAASAALSRVCSTASLVPNNIWRYSFNTVTRVSEELCRGALCSFWKRDFSASIIASWTFLLPFSESVLTVNAKARDMLEDRSVTSQRADLTMRMPCRITNLHWSDCGGLSSVGALLVRWQECLPFCAAG